MALRADRKVELVAARDLEEVRDRGRIEVEVGVDECDPLAVCCERADLDGVPLAEVAVVMDHAGPGLAGRKQSLGGVVDRAVRDDNQLDLRRGDAGSDESPDLLDVADDLVASV